MTVETVQPVRKDIVVPTSPDKAFEIFTDRMGTWWNPGHSIGSEPLASVVVEPVAGGRWYERGEHGAECDWGRVLVWDPPHRVVLAWQIDGSWAYDPKLVTEVEVRFTPHGDATRVELEHRGLDAFGAAAAGVRESFDSPNGWRGLLERFAAAV